MLMEKSPFYFYYAFFLLIVIIERLRAVLTKSKKQTEKIYYKWSFPLLLATYLITAFSSLAELLLKVERVDVIVSFCGLLSYILGAYLRRSAMRELGENWSLQLEIKKNHQLITSGIFKTFKHPYYLAVTFELLGFSLAANAFYSLALVFFLQLPLLIIRAHLEEKVLISYFGDSYKKYRQGKII